MIRFHYGPWDERYYQVLPFLKSRGLIKIIKKNSTYEIYLTEKGVEVANLLKKNSKFLDIVKKIKAVKKVMGSKSGTQRRD